MLIIPPLIKNIKLPPSVYSSVKTCKFSLCKLLLDSTFTALFLVQYTLYFRSYTCTVKTALKVQIKNTQEWIDFFIVVSAEVPLEGGKGTIVKLGRGQYLGWDRDNI